MRNFYYNYYAEYKHPTKSLFGGFWSKNKSITIFVNPVIPGFYPSINSLLELVKSKNSGIYAFEFDLIINGYNETKIVTFYFVIE